MIDYIIERKDDTSIRQDAYEVRMRQNNEYRRAELQVDHGTEPGPVVVAQIDALWESGVLVNGEWFIAAQQRQIVPLYKAVQLAVQGTLMAAADLDAMNAAGAGVLASNDAVGAQWAAYRDTLIAANGGDLTAFELHMAMCMFTVIGRQAGGG